MRGTVTGSEQGGARPGFDRSSTRSSGVRIVPADWAADPIPPSDPTEPDSDPGGDDGDNGEQPLRVDRPERELVPA
jgi:hypothetical protein